MAELCVPTIAETLPSRDYLVCCNDGSTEYGPEFLEQWADKVYSTKNGVGIERQRQSHFSLYWEQSHVYTHLYLTDSDALHDPDWREKALELQAKARGAPVCLYNTTAHSLMEGNTLEEDEKNGIIWRAVAPGISYLLTREHVAKIMPVLNHMAHWDWFVPSILKNRFAVSATSYVDHIGWGGLHHPLTDDIDGGDRATNPTHFLQYKRMQVIEALR